MGRTNIVLNDRLLRHAMRVTGSRTKRQVVDLALREMVGRASVYRALKRLQGKLAWEGDVAAWRRGRT